MSTHRLAELNERIASLRTQLTEAEHEKFELLKEIHDSERSVLNTLSTQARNALYRRYIETDLELYWWLSGTGKFEKFFQQINEKRQKEGKKQLILTPYDRIMHIPHIGKSYAEEILRVAKEKGVFSE